ncbi:cytochrome P450 [Fomitopsis betulina]|nr:cytochrome P450 [Fomitopsis betulina]
MLSSSKSVFQLVLVAALGSIVLAVNFLRSRRARNSPPGPEGLPLLGNILHFPSDNIALTCASWASKYGEFTQFHLFTRPVLILHTLRAARALLTTNARLTSARPVLPAFGERGGWAHTTALLAPGPAWHTARRLAAPVLGSRAGVVACEPAMAIQVPRLVPRLLVCAPGDGDKLRKQITQTVVETTLAILYGVELRDDGDPIVDAVSLAMGYFSRNVLPGALLVDWLPLPLSLLQYLPDWLTGATPQQWTSALDAVLDPPFERAKAAIAEGTATPSLISACLSPQAGAKPDETDMDAPSRAEYEQAVKHAAASILIGATDSTTALLETLLVLLATHPSVQHTAQAEVDRVLASSIPPRCLPVLADASAAPYVRGLVLEVLRLGAALPLGMPHVLSEDILYKGHILKQGTTLLADIRGMLRDPAVYKDPATCDPGRYTPSAKDPAGTQDPREVVWGFGKRTCPGLYLGETCLTLATLHVLAAFDVSPAHTSGDSTMIEGTSEIEYTTGLVSHPACLAVTLRPRSEAVVEAARKIAARMTK